MMHDLEQILSFLLCRQRLIFRTLISHRSRKNGIDREYKKLCFGSITFQCKKGVKLLKQKISVLLQLLFV